MSDPRFMISHAGDSEYSLLTRSSDADKQSAEIEHDFALERALVTFIKDNTLLYKLFKDNPAIKRFIANVSFLRTYQPPS